MQQKRVTIEVVARLIIIFLSTSLSSIRDDFVLFTSVSFQDRLPFGYRLPPNDFDSLIEDLTEHIEIAVASVTVTLLEITIAPIAANSNSNGSKSAITSYRRIQQIVLCEKKKIEDRSFNIFIVIESSRPVCLADRPPFYQWRISIEKLILCFLFSYRAGKQAPDSSIDILSELLVERASIATPLPSP